LIRRCDVEKPVKRKKPPYSIKDKFLKKCYMEALAQIAKEHYKKKWMVIYLTPSNIKG